MHIYIKTHGFILLSTNGRERERSSFVYFSGVHRTCLALLLITVSFSLWPCNSLHCKVSSSIRIHAPWLLLCFSLSDLITSVYICRAAPCFPSLIVCLCGHGLVRANRHALAATLGLGVLPSCLRSNRAHTCLITCSS